MATPALVAVVVVVHVVVVPPADAVVVVVVVVDGMVPAQRSLGAAEQLRLRLLEAFLLAWLSPAGAVRRG